MAFLLSDHLTPRHRARERVKCQRARQCQYAVHRVSTPARANVD